MRRGVAIAVGLGSALWVAIAPAQVAGPKDVASKFGNRDSIVRTRHNLTQGVDGINASLMDTSRNNYGEVCVYCHTPHASSTVVAAPLWNRTKTDEAGYTTYDSLGTSSLTQPVSAPGVNSLTCLSCHDGTVAVDSIINMPNRSPFGDGRSGNYDPAQMTTQNNTFLSLWRNPGGANVNHTVLGAPNAASTPGSAVGCMVCHSNTAAGDIFPDATNFAVFVIGTDLRNDHPVGITLPSVGDFNPITGVSAGVSFFDRDGDGRPGKDEVRLYDTGEGPEVECASCHDPHGVAPTPGADFNPTFLRVSNTDSGLCQTCHAK